MNTMDRSVLGSCQATFFWTDPHCRKSFCVFVLDFLASKYVMDNSLTLFVSQETRDKVDDDLFQTHTPILDNQEVVEVVDVDVEEVEWDYGEYVSKMLNC